MIVESIKCQQFQMDNEINAPIASLDLEDWLDFITSSTSVTECKNKQDSHAIPHLNTAKDTTNSNPESPHHHMSPFNASTAHSNSTNLTETIDLCSSLEDLVKTFDKNVKECLTNYKDIDIGQLAPVQVRLQEDIINDSQ